MQNKNTKQMRMRMTQENFFFCLLLFCMISIIDCCSNCSSCNILDSCTGTCYSGYYKGCLLGYCRCQGCSTGCATCTGGGSTQCQSCSTGYYLSGGNFCPKCPTGCSACSSATSCSSCDSGYYVSGTSCPACDSNCLTCQTSSTYCLTCQNKYFINSNVCDNCPALCETCTSLTSCQTCTDTHTSGSVCDCINGYYQSGSSCQQCQTPCSTCQTSASYCLSCTGSHRTLTLNACPCDSGYVEISGTCQACTLPCLTCSTTQSFCTSCSDSAQMTITSGICSCGSQKYFDNTYQCFPCTEPCSNCVFSSTHCTSCTDVNMAVDGSHNCNCNDGFYLDNLACIACTYPCTKCSSPTYCTQCDAANNWILDATNHICICKDTYYLNINICSVCNLPCANCDIGPDNCQTCIDTNQILSGTNTCDCNIGFIPNGYYCDQCVLPCTTCTTTVNTCTGCIDPQQILTLNQCICSPGYGDSGTGCAVCKSPCLTCSSSVTTCESCVDPSIFILSNNKCYCVDGQFANDLQCEICSPQCKTCVTNSDFCLSCNDRNHILTLRNECICNIGYLPTAGSCLQCQPPCFACQLNTEYCTECLDPLALIQNNLCICPDGKYMDNNFICQICNPLCLTCSDQDICLTCNDYFYLDTDHKCQLCSIPCGRCNGLNSCMDCIRGYYISGDQCQNCSLGCIECIDFSNCQFCQDGYYLNQQQQCQLCQQPCDLCQFSATQCLACSNPTFILQNYKCQCQQNQYEINQQCVDCQFPCQSCLSDSQCLSCIQLKQIILLKEQCVCIDGYFFDGSQCLICDRNCKTCSYQTECQSCDSQLFRQLVNNQCLCQDGYFDQGQLQCIKCSPENGIQIDECQYSNCSDGVWTQGEQCDDGNKISRDGCSDCQIDYGYSCLNIILQPSTCMKCIDDCNQCDENNICQKCNNGFYLQDNQCLVCNILCKTCDSYFSCLTCNFIMINHQCRYCEDKVGHYSKNGYCVTICGDNIQAESEQCDDGNTIDGDGCDKSCKLEQGFYFSNGVPLQRIYPKPIMKEIYSQLFDPKRVFTIYYEEDIQYFVLDFEENFQIQIDNYQLYQDYTYNITNNSQNQTYLTNSLTFQKFNLTITIIFKSTTLDKHLVLFMSPQIFVNSQGSKQQITSLTQKISDFQYIEPTTKQNTQSAINANYYILYCILILIALSILFGGIEIFYNLLDLLQLVSYLQYVNTQFPYNLETFINIFSFAQFQLLDQYVSISQLYQNYIDQQQLKAPPLKISNDGFNSNIIINFSSLITIWLTFIGSYLLAHLIPIFISNISVRFSLNQGEFIIQMKTVAIMFKLYVIKQCWIIRSQFFYSGFLRTFISTTYDFCFFLMLNIFSLSFNGYLINSIGSYVTLFFIAVYIGILKLSINAVSITYTSQLEYAKYGAIYEGLKFTPVCKYFHIFLLLKKFLFMASLILSYQDPLFQILQISMLSLVQILYLIHFQPLEEKYEQRKQLFCEIYMGLTQFLLFFLVVDDLQGLFAYETRSNIGWFCIAFISLMLITQIILDIHQQWSILLKIYYRIKKYIMQKFTQHIPIIQDNMQQSQMSNDIIQI